MKNKRVAVQVVIDLNYYGVDEEWVMKNIIFSLPGDVEDALEKKDLYAADVVIKTVEEFEMSAEELAELDPVGFDDEE